MQNPFSKVGVRHIVITRGEGLIEECDKPIACKSFAEAAKILGEMARTAPDSGGYDKTDFQVTFRDGETYEGRVDLKRKHSLGGYNLSEHIRGFLGLLAGTKRPAWMNDKQWADSLKMHAGEREKAAKFLETYELN